jgi:hypothetical protein
MEDLKEQVRWLHPTMRNPTDIARLSSDNFISNLVEGHFQGKNEFRQC